MSVHLNHGCYSIELGACLHVCTIEAECKARKLHHMCVFDHYGRYYLTIMAGSRMHGKEAGPHVALCASYF